MKLLVILLLVAAVYSAPAPDVTPVILPKVHVTAPDVTVVKQPYVIQQPEPVIRHVYYASDPAYVHLPGPYVQHVTYPQPIIHAPSYIHHPAINYIL